MPLSLTFTVDQELYITCHANNSSCYYHPLSIIEETVSDYVCLSPVPLTSKFLQIYVCSAFSMKLCLCIVGMILHSAQNADLLPFMSVG